MSGMFRVLILLGLLVTGCASIDDTPRTPLSPGDQADVRRAEDYFNGVRTLKARFTQISGNGGTAEGTLYLARPGRLRLDYDPPVPILMIANDGFLIRYDRNLKAVTRLPIDSTPIGLFVREHIRLSGDITVTQVERNASGLHITLFQTEDPQAGRITLTFRTQPFALTDWQITDARGNVTRILLTERQTGVPLDAALFRFTEPRA
jgi:outer membrane lipoprotein-sorting protein